MKIDILHYILTQSQPIADEDMLDLLYRSILIRPRYPRGLAAIEFNIASWQSISSNEHLSPKCMKTTAIVKNGIIEPSDKRVLQEGAHLIIEEDTRSPTISELEKMFPVDIDRELEPLFKQNPHSIDAIQKSIEITSRHFSGDRLFVTTIEDPEHDRLNQLSIIVKTSLDPATAFQKTSDLDAEFLQDSTLSNILIHVEFQ